MKHYITKKGNKHWIEIEAKSLRHAKKLATRELHVYKNDRISVAIDDGFGNEKPVSYRYHGKWTNFEED